MGRVLHQWMPDGKRIFFRISKVNPASLYSASADGGGHVDSMQAFRDGVHEGTVTPDGRSLVFRTATSSGRDIWSVHLGTGEAPTAVLATPFQELQPRLSADGHWLAYASDESGTLEVYVRAFPGGSGRVRVSTDGGTEPIWARDGRRLFYRSGARMIAPATGGTQMVMVLDWFDEVRARLAGRARLADG